jgi:DNA-binding CsgD family transcriptional regulator
MTTALGSRDVRKALELVGEAAEARSLDDFRACILDRLPGLVPSEITSYNEIEADGGFVLAMDPMDAWTPQRERDFLRLADQHPLIVHFKATGDPSPRKITDLMSRRAFRRTELYRSVYAPMGVEYQMAVNLPGAAGAVVGIAVNRDRRDFDERDRALLDVLRPHLVQLRDAAAARERDRLLASLVERVTDADGRGVVALRRDGSVAFASPRARELMAAHLPPPAAPGRLPEALAAWVVRRRRPGLAPPPGFAVEGPGGRLTATWLPASAASDPDVVLLACGAPAPSPESLAPLGLSRRQAEVLARVAQGDTNGQIAHALGVSPRTVQKHLEHVFDRLGVRTRAAATARALGAALPAA